MTDLASARTFDKKLIDGFYVEAIVLADEARSFFDQRGEESRAVLNQMARLDFACESLKVTTRIMHAIAWLLTQRAIFAGELDEDAGLDERHQLGAAAGTEAQIRALFCDDMAGLIVASEDLYARLARFEAKLLARARREEMIASPARDLLGRLEQSL